MTVIEVEKKCFMCGRNEKVLEIDTDKISSYASYRSQLFVCSKCQDKVDQINEEKLEKMSDQSLLDLLETFKITFCENPTREDIINVLLSDVPRGTLYKELSRRKACNKK